MMPYAEYAENEVLHQDPVELVRLLYVKAIQKLAEASEHLAAGRIQERAGALAHACEIVLELQASIDRDRGGDIGLRLAQIYDYVLVRLNEANAEQAAAPIDECRQLLETVLKGWAEAADEAKRAHQAETEPAEAVAAGHAWTL